MIKRILVENFKGIEKIEMNTGWLNVLIGPNASGKTTILESLDFLHAVATNRLDSYLKDREMKLSDLRNKHGRKQLINIEIDFELSSTVPIKTPLTYEFEFNISLSRINKESLYIKSQSEKKHYLMRRNLKSYRMYSAVYQTETEGDYLVPSAGMFAVIDETDNEIFPEIYAVKKFIESLKSYYIWDPKLLRRASKDGDSLGAFGEKIASTLYSLKRNEPATFSNVIRFVKKALPFVKDIDIKNISYGLKEIVITEKSDEQDAKINAKQLSDGTLSIIALAIVRYNDVNSLVTIEEPENGVHPRLLHEMIQLLKDLTVLKPEYRSQVFFTTHSPYVIDEFYEDMDSIYLVKRNKNKGTIVERLSDQDYAEESKKMAELLFNHSLGELWVSGELRDDVK